jgi:hypothetical protein
VKSGNTIKTISPQRTIFAKAELDEVFPSDFAIYELSKFLGALTLFDDPEVEFFDEHLKISHNKNSIRYTYADPSMIITPPDKEITLPSVDISFELTSEDLARLQKALSILRVPEMSITGEDGTIYVKAVNNKNPSSDSFSIAVGVSDKAFNMIFKAENLKIMNRNYTVNISSKGISEFKSDNLTYWIATESQSKFED